MEPHSHQPHLNVQLHLIFFSFVFGFVQNLVRAGSAILDPGTKDHWEQIQRTEGGTAQLLRNFEDYANTLAQNVRKTYLKPFTIVTENMSECWNCVQIAYMYTHVTYFLILGLFSYPFSFFLLHSPNCGLLGCVRPREGDITSL